MSAPLKPWERIGINTRSSALPFEAPTRPPFGTGGVRPNALRNSDKTMDATSSQKTTRAPPLPPRPQTQRSNAEMMYGSSRYGYGDGMYGGYNGIYGGGYGGYGMYGGGYGSYGGYGLGMNRFVSPFNRSGSSSFVGRAEESSRAAFQSIESIVQAFGSVAMMLESTHFAMHNTFLAVLSMADHFSRLRTHLVSVLGAFTLFKAIRYIFRKISALLGFVKNQRLEDELWEDATVPVVASGGHGGGDGKKPISWPILLFFGVVLGTPLIIWKLLQSLMNDENSTKDWKTGEGDHVVARAEYDFDGEGEEELSFRAGNILRLAPKGKQPRIRGWLLGTIDGSSEGIVPANYVKILGLRRGKQKDKELAEKSIDERTKVSLTQPDKHSISEDTLNHEFYQEEKGDSNGLISSQHLITEEPFNEGTLGEDEISDSDSQVLNEEKT